MEKRHPEDLVLRKAIKKSFPRKISKRCLNLPLILYPCNSREIEAIPHANSFWFNELDSRENPVT